MRRAPAATVRIAALLTALGSVLQAARAEEPPPPRETQFFEKYDANLDGKVTLEEFTAGAGDAASFSLIDKNKDNVVSPDELGLPADYKPRPRAERKPEAAPGKPGGPAGGRGEEFRKRMREMDADGDGRVSRAEWKGEAEGFDRFDVNKDGFLDKEDRPAGAKPGMPGGMAPPEDVAKRFAEMDRDQSGKVESAEMPEMLRERMLKSDADGDGALSKDEFAEGMKKALRRDGAGPGKGPGPGARGPDGQGGGAPGLEILKRFDTDRDGRVERDQFPGSDEAFAKLDKDGDGVLTEKDFPKPPPQDLIATCDKDGDGRLSRAEFRGTDAEWRALDKNQDGWVSADEAPKPDGARPPSPPKPPETPAPR